MKTMKNIFLFYLLLTLNSHFILGQTPSYRLQSDKIGNVGISYTSWKIEKEEITELAIPVSFIYPFSDKIRFFALTSPAFSNLSSDENFELGGLSDVKCGGHVLAFNDQWLFTLGLNLPTGKSALKPEEYSTANIIAMPAFRFRVPSMGQGFDLQLGVSSAREMGDFIVGYGVSYLMKGSFQPLHGLDADYNPGDELTLTIGTERNLFGMNRDVRFTGDILYSIYFSDTWEEKEIFQSGNRLLFQLAFQMDLEPLNIAIFMRDRIKAKNKVGSGEIFDLERKNRNGNQFETQCYLYYNSSKNVQLSGIFDLKLYSNNDYDTGGATLYGPGAGIQIRMSSLLSLNSEFRMYFGKINAGSENVDASGLNMSGTIQYTIR